MFKGSALFDTKLFFGGSTIGAFAFNECMLTGLKIDIAVGVDLLGKNIGKTVFQLGGVFTTIEGTPCGECCKPCDTYTVELLPQYMVETLLFIGDSGCQAFHQAFGYFAQEYPTFSKRV